MRYLLFLFILAASFGVMNATADITLRPVLNHQEFNFQVSVINHEALNETQEKAVSAEKWRQFFGYLLPASAAAIVATGLLSWMSYFIFMITAANLFSYVWMWFMIKWPSSLFDWNIVFLFPTAGTAPVIACITASAIFLIISVMMIRIMDRFRVVNFDPQHWGPLLLALICWITSFISSSSTAMTEFPESFSWGIFTLGVVFAVIGTVFIYFDFFKRKIIFK